MQPMRTTCLGVLGAVVVATGFANAASALTACTAADIIAQDSNCPSGTGPCLIKKDFTIGTGCTLDFGLRDVTLANLETMTIGSGSVTIRAGNFTVGGGAFIDARGNSVAPNDRGGFLVIQTIGAILVQVSGSRVARVFLDGNTAGGTVEF